MKTNLVGVLMLIDPISPALIALHSQRRRPPALEMAHSRQSPLRFGKAMPRCQETAAVTLEQMVAETEGDMPSTPGRPKTAGGRLHTEESRAKISAANKGRVPWNVGKQHSEETRRRIAEGTRKAMQRKAQERMRERERLRAEEPETYAALLAKEVASDAMKKAAAALKVKQKNEQRRRQAAERRQLKPEIFRGGAPTVAVRQRAVASCGRANFTFTAESRAKISESLRKRWQDPEYVMPTTQSCLQSCRRRRHTGIRSSFCCASPATLCVSLAGTARAAPTSQCGLRRG